MHPDRLQNFQSLIQQCKIVLGLNFPILLQTPFEKYESLWLNNQIESASKCAFSIVQTLFAQQKFELHESLCLFFLNDLNVQKRCLTTAEIYRQLALNYDLHQKHEAAEKTYNEAFEHLALVEAENETEKWKIFGSLWYNRSSPVRSKESREKLAIYTRNSLHFFEHLNDTDGISLCLNRLALLLPEDSYTEKFELLRRVISINSGPLGNKKNIAMAQFNIGYYTFLSGDEKLGEAYMNDALALVHQNTNSRYWGLAQLQMAKAFFKRNKPTEAKQMCLKSLDVFNSLKVSAHIEEANLLLQQIEAHL